MEDRIIDFLVKEKALRLGESPWPTYDEEDDVYNVDWNGLFPPVAALRDGDEEWDLFGDGWEVGFDADFLGEIEEAVGEDPPPSSSELSSGTEAGFGGQWDTCAWYQPIHFFGLDWGIFIREDCVRRQAVWVARFVEPTARLSYGGKTLAKALVRAATYAYFLHEHFHHKVECLGLRLHVVERTSRYLPYHSMVYQKAAGTDDQLEEALANANMYHRLGHQPYAKWISPPIRDALREYLRWSFPFNPPGYRRALDYLKKTDFDDGENLLQGQVKEATLQPVQPTADWDIAPRLMQSIFPVTSNIWTVVPKGQRSIFPTVQPVRTCGTKALIALLERVGYTHVGGTKHDKLEHSGWPTIILPRNRSNLSPGVVKTVLHALNRISNRSFTLHDLPQLFSSDTRIVAAEGMARADSDE